MSIYVTGHRNPDTDSIVSAIAYAHLRRSLGETEYKAVRLGNVNDETQHILDYFGAEAPELINNMRTQVRDLDFDRPTCLNKSVPLELAWNTLKDGDVLALPILEDDGHLFGLLSSGDIAKYDMHTLAESNIRDVPVFNILSVLEGVIVNDACAVSAVTGNVIIALPQSGSFRTGFSREDVVICGNQPGVIEDALRANVRCLIICQSDIDRTLKDYTGETCIISTPLDARRTSRVIYQAMPVRRICSTEGLITFHLDDYIDDVREQLLESRFRSYPVLDENDRVVGTLGRYHLLRPRRKKVVLVDHNEAAQSVRGLEQAEIIAIIDHHRLADIQTGQPIYVRNEPVGCTNTILTAMYQENGVVPPPQIAGLMAAAILSDTVMFRSPTCTKRDIAMANRLAGIAGISLEQLGKEIFTCDHSGPAEELFHSDYKQFLIAGRQIGVSQITCSDSSELLARKEEFLELMDAMRVKEKYDIVLLMVTDILQDGSHLFYSGSDDIIAKAFNATPKDKHVFMPGVMSRKKQIIPMLTALWG